MKFKATIQVEAVVEWDTDHYTADTPEEAVKEQLRYWEEGVCSLMDLLPYEEDALRVTMAVKEE